MSTSVQTPKLVAPDATLTMAGLRDPILADPELNQRRRAEVASAFRCLEKTLGRPLATIPAAPIELRKLLKDVTPAMAGVSAGRWRNVHSQIQFAFGWAGLSKIPGRYKEPLTPEWAALLASVTHQGDHCKVGRLGRYCGMNGIAPVDVTDAVMDTYLRDLLAHSLSQEPERRHRDAAIAWNRCVGLYPAWPQQRLAVPDNRNTYAVPWSAFPPTLKTDVDAWLHHRSGADPFAELDADPLRETSLVTRAKQIHLFISALVLQREDPAELKSLADVVTQDRVAKGLLFFWDRAGGKASVHGGQIAGVVCAIARHWVKLGQPELDWLKARARKITPKATGMTTKNRSRLTPFYDRATMVALLSLPERIRAEVVRAGVPTVGLALQIQTAVAIEVLIMAPIRIKNLRELDLGTHLLRSRDGGLTVVLAEDDAKNEMAHEVELSAPTVQLIDLYFDRYWPLLGGEGSAWLFPGRTPGQPKSDDRLREQIQDAVRTRCGLVINPQLFRHLAAMIILLDNPSAHGQVQRVLAHKSLGTTQQYYAGMETRAAVQHHDKLVLEMRAEPPPLIANRRRRGARG